MTSQDIAVALFIVAVFVTGTAVCGMFVAGVTLVVRWFRRRYTAGGVVNERKRYEETTALASIRRPVRYDQEGQRIVDVNGETVCWCHISHVDRAEERQDAIGKLLVDLINGAS